MGKSTLLEKIRDWIGGISFDIFLWAGKMSADEYWNKIYEHEKICHKLNKDN